MGRRRTIEDPLEVEVYEGGAWQPVGLTGLLRRLGALDYTPARAVSMYLETRWADEQQRERVRLQVSDRVRELRARWPDDPALAADLESALELAMDHVRQIADVGIPGVAYFRASAAGLDLRVRAREPLPTLVAASPRLVLRPLAALAHGHERALVALAHADEVRIYEIALGRVTGEATLTGDVPRRHKQGGFSALRFQRHRDERIQALHRDAAATLARLFDAGSPARVLVGGPLESAATFVHVLPERVRKRVLPLAEVDRYDPIHEVIAAVEARVASAAGDEERALIAEIETLARSAVGRGAIGLGAVVDALNEGRAMRVLVSDQLAARLAVCDRCHTLSLDDGAACTVCGGHRQRLDATEAIVRAALPLAARLDLVSSDRLAPYGGAVASLRF
jgi:peptide subunit release factor 1 (eRF1)